MLGQSAKAVAMGYQLVFWQEASPTAASSDPETVYSELLSGDEPTGLAPLPVEAILEELGQRFPTAFADTSTSPTFWTSDDQQSSIEFTWSKLHVCVEFRPFGPSQHAAANEIIDVLNSFDCPLFDPQVGERFGKPGCG